ncbi:MAG: hypothetical protein ACI9QA_000079 [Methanobacteriota archaeon]|jgi:hypothetical protein|uniref:Uncharacterized protein n=1 Tax=Halorutilus salinus TaxID=2487751 RepID=A0A9Q4C5H7_9EURY|nr:hypothetical protein [Halorutilus salinus]MCX2819314.1 hypothetical protein [Halorutilus salinus]
MSLNDDAERFLDEADSLTGLPKRELQKRVFRLKRELGARYDFSVEGFDDDYEARLVHQDGETEARFTVDRRHEETEIDVFVLIDGEAVVNEVRRL